MHSSVAASVDKALQKNNFWHIDPFNWAQIEGQSIDRAILEKCEEIKCIKFDGDWSDLGDWNALASQLEPDASGNLIRGSVTQIDCNNNILWDSSERTHLVGLGLKNIVAVATEGSVIYIAYNVVPSA